MIRWLLLVVFVAGCPTSHEKMLDGDVPLDGDAPLDGNLDAPRDGTLDAPDAEDPDCAEPPDELCCCSGDVVHRPPRCEDGRWVCGRLGQLWGGFDCTNGCGAACAPFCPTETTCDPMHGYLAAIRGRACTEASQCVAAVHTTDCCGTRGVAGIRETDAWRFEGLASMCASHLGDCDCAPGPTTADDGSTGDPSDVVVECVDGRCRTRF